MSVFDWFAGLPTERQWLYGSLVLIAILLGFVATIFLPAVRGEGEGFGEPSPPSAPAKRKRSPFAGKRVAK